MKGKNLMLLCKMQCAGADYLFADCFDTSLDNPAETAGKVCDRYFGVGAFGLVLLLYSNDADFRIDIYNRFGEKIKPNPDVLCCAAEFARKLGLFKSGNISADTDLGVKYAAANDDGSFTINAGIPVTTPQLIPVDSTDESFVNKTIVVGNAEYQATCLSVGDNPFTVIFMNDTDELNSLEIYKTAPFIEGHNIFPVGTNVVFVNAVDRAVLQERCWLLGEREVTGNGFGAAAAFFAARLNGLADDSATVETLGGDLKIDVSADGFVYVTLSAEKVFEIEW